MTHFDSRTLKGLFRGWIEEGAPRGIVPAIMSRSFRLPGGHQGSAVFGGPGVVGPGVSRTLATYTEGQAIGLLCSSEGVLDLLTIAIATAAERHFEPAPQTWQILELRPGADLGLPSRGQPGDIDILVGPWRNGRPCFDWLAGCEVKLRVTRADGRPGSTRGFGTTQAAGLYGIGCDLSSVLHILIADHTEPSDTLEYLELVRACTMFGPDQGNTERAMMKAVLTRLGDGVGYSALWWNHQVGHGPALNASAELIPFRAPRPTVRPGNARSKRAFDHALRHLWAREEFAGHYRLRRCPECCAIVPADLRLMAQCPRCARPWFPAQEPSVPADLRPLPYSLNRSPGRR